MATKQGIKNWGTDLSRTPVHSVRFVNAAIQKYAMGTGPMVEVGVVGEPGLYRITRARIRHGVAEGKLLSTGKWVAIRGVILQ